MTGQTGRRGRDATGRTRIQQKNRDAILDAALEVFSREGINGARLDAIAKAAGLSKPNLLYYFGSKDAIYANLLERQLELWLEPLRAIDLDGDPVEEILAYMRRKLTLSRTYPRESRLFALEVLSGAHLIRRQIAGPLRDLVDEKVAVIEGWCAEARLAPVDGRHLIFSIWSTTQHYADFDVQVGLLTRSAPKARRFSEAEEFLETLFRRALTPPRRVIES